MENAEFQLKTISNLLDEHLVFIVMAQKYSAHCTAVFVFWFYLVKRHKETYILADRVTNDDRCLIVSWGSLEFWQQRAWMDVEPLAGTLGYPRL
jgi:hypothetical protein